MSCDAHSSMPVRRASRGARVAPALLYVPAMRTTLITIALASALTSCIQPDDGSADTPTTATSQAITSWGGWRRMPGNTNVALATVTLGGRLSAFDKALDNSIQMMTFTRSTGSSAPRVIGGSADAALAATVCWDGIYLFQKGADRHVYMNKLRTTARIVAGWVEVPGGGTDRRRASMRRVLRMGRPTACACT